VRDIKLKGKVYKTTRQNVDALAWATNRRGRNPWKDDENVVVAIWEYLCEHGVELMDTATYGGSRQLRNAMMRLVKEGYAEVAPIKAGSHFTMFKFKDDVNLNGHTPRMIERPTENYIAEAHQYPARGPAPSIGMDMPLPPGPKPVRYKEEDINKYLDKWAENNPEDYAQWAEVLVERLGAIYG